MENGICLPIVSHLERQLELNGLEAPDELQINTVTQQMTQQNSEKSKPHCHRCEKPGHYRNQCRQLKREKDPAWNNTNTAENNINDNMVMVKQTLTPTKKFPTIPTRPIQIIQKTKDLDLFTHPVRPVVKLPTPHRSVTLGKMQLTDRFRGVDDRKDRTKPNGEMLKTTQMGTFKLQPKL